jgi:hypothetical protein
MMGQTGYHLAADGNGDGVVDDDDYNVWRNNFGATWTGSGSGSGAASISAPEPATGFLSIAIMGGAAWRRRRVGTAKCCAPLET